MVLQLHFLNEAMLEEYLSSPRRDRTLLHHVRNCPECQAMVRRGRLARLYLYRPTQSPPGEHLGNDEITAFCEDALTETATTHTMAHLAECEQCLGAYKELSDALAMPAQVPTSTQTKIAIAAFTPNSKKNQHKL